ncbi:FAD-binding oxidoreductase [Paenibacillus hunanensis]|uniref:NAD(P)/FAD-dependent oxidoreductase n=1 Tax=Paenibacillus hunanensis TaxID=539262 RepID=UPI002026E211|nr:FAD-binding oxidoreductase [Paenibacillus hunanensis]MCL9661292.1 FAD-binding oxidoreductase [Paenibacillus hunanensis]
MRKTVIVVGGGILGASTAYQLSKQDIDVIVIDRQHTGQATDAAAGIICPWLSQRRNQTWYRLASGGARFYPEFIAELAQHGEHNTGYARVGALSLHRDHDKILAMQKRALKRLEAAPEIGEITLLNEDEVRERFPLLDEGYEAVHVSGAARIDGRLLRDALIRAAVRHGATLLHGEAVLEQKGQRVVGVKVAGQRYAADEVVICAGAWATELLAGIGITFQMHYQKAQIMHVKLETDDDTGSWPVVMPPTDQYLLAFEQQRIVIGATHENDVTGYDTRVTPGGMQEVLNKGLELAPQLANSTFTEMRVGFRPFTADFLPVFGAMPGWSGLFIANGLGASGLTMGPYIGYLLAQLVLGEQPELPVEEYTVAKALG